MSRRILPIAADAAMNAVTPFLGEIAVGTTSGRARFGSTSSWKVLAHLDEVQALAGTITSGRRIYATYASATSDATTPTIYPQAPVAGTVAEIPLTDTGTHTDPVVGGTVNNSGIFRWSVSPAGYQRIADEDAASAKNYAAQAAAAASNVPAYAAALNLNNNRFNPDKVVLNTLVNANGSLSSVGSGGAFYATGLMACAPGDQLVANGQTAVNGNTGYGWAFSDATKTLIGGTAGTNAGVPITVPAGAFYAQCSFNASETSIAQCGVFVGAAETPRQLVTVQQLGDYTAAMGIGAKPVDLSRAIPNTVVRADGTLAAIGNDGTFLTSGLIPVVPGGTVTSNVSTDITGDGTYGYGWHGISGRLIPGSHPGVAAGVAMPVPANAFYWQGSINTTQGLGSNWLVTTSERKRGRLSGKKVMWFGDSITAKYNGLFQAWVCSELGLTIPYQDARGGRTTREIFEMYQPSSGAIYQGDPVNGLSTGGIIPTSLPQAGGDGSVPPGAVQQNQPGPWIAAGSTLAQTLASVDIVFINLGTNDFNLLGANAAPYPMLGSITDPVATTSSVASSTSYYSWLRWAIEGILKANPGVRLIWVGPYYINAKPDPIATVVAAQRAVCAAYGIPYLDLLTKSGINTLTMSTYLQGDYVHPQAKGSINVLGRMQVGMLEQVY